MTSKEALKALERLENTLIFYTTTFGTQEADWRFYFEKVKDKLIELLVRDTPMKVIIGGIDKHGRFREVICPICHQWLTFTEKENICPKCGQRLDWSE